MDKHCQNCRFFNCKYGYMGECRRHAPAHKQDTGTTGLANASWPHTSQDDWCGDWQAKDKSPDVSIKAALEKYL
jgi:hypothetical protein